MGLSRKFNELNSFANELSSAIYEIYENYLNNDIDFPYKTVSVLNEKYDKMREEIYKSKYSKLNEIFYNFSVRKKEIWNKFNAPTVEEIFNNASEKSLSLIRRDVKKYLPSDDITKEAISNRLVPIVKNLKLSSITGLYNEFKKILSKSHFNNLDKREIYLQQMFVGFIMTNLAHNPMNKYSRSRMMYTYDEVCKKILDEPVLSLEKIKGRGK